MVCRGRRNRLGHPGHHFTGSRDSLERAVDVSSFEIRKTRKVCLFDRIGVPLPIESGPLVASAFLVFADTIARTVVAPAELPVGVVTALAGVPVFLWLLIRHEEGM